MGHGFPEQVSFAFTLTKHCLCLWSEAKFGIIEPNSFEYRNLSYLEV